jgi:hypothetical protein
MHELTFHPVADLFPLLEGQDFRDLVEDIRVHGQREPVWTHKGQIIDGRNRYRACREIGVEPKTREWDGRGSLLAFVVSLNLHRRHLCSSQRAAIAVDMLPLLEAEAKERQKKAGEQHGRGRGRKVPEKVPEAKRDDGESRKQAAKLAGTNSRYVSEAKRVREEAPDLFEGIRRGELNVYEAKNELRKRRIRAEREARAEAGRALSEGLLTLEIRKSWSRRHFKELAAEVRSRPDFARRQEEAQQLQADSERLYREAREAGRLGDELHWRLQKDIRETVEAEHGPIVAPGFSGVRVDEAERQRIEAIEDPQEKHEALCRAAGLCLYCDAKLGEADDVPDKPGYRYVVCSWCKAHRGETHCEDCGAPLPPGDDAGWCDACWDIINAVESEAHEGEADLPGGDQEPGVTRA